MKMTEYEACCEKCLQRIGNESPNAARFWMDLCRSYDVEKDSITLAHDIPEIRSLENLGFLVSTERNRNVVAKLCGIHLAGNEKFFCLGWHQHD